MGDDLRLLQYCCTVELHDVLPVSEGENNRSQYSERGQKA